MRMHRSISPATLFITLLLGTYLTGFAAEISVKTFESIDGRELHSKTRRGFEQFLDGDCDGAAKSFANAVDKNADDYFALYGQGIQAMGQSQSQHALESFCNAFRYGKSSRWAELFLTEIKGVLPFCTDAEPFYAMVRQLNADPGMARPYVLDQLNELHGDWLMERGQFNAAAESYKRLQYVTSWALSGPFDNRDKAGFNTAYEPELGVDLEKTMPGRNRRVGWYRPLIQVSGGRMNLVDLFEPHIHVLAYAATWVKVENDSRAVLHAGCAGALSIFVNGKQAGALDEYNDYGPDKMAVPVLLRKGWNQILVKSAVVEDTEWGFSIRLSRPEGGPIPNLVADSSSDALKEYLSQGKVNGAPVEDTVRIEPGLLDALKETLKNQPRDPIAQFTFGNLVASRNLGNKEDRTAAKAILNAIEIAPNSPYPKLRLGVVNADINEARQNVESVLKAHAELPQAYEVLARMASQTNLHVIAEDYSRQSIARFGNENSGMCPLYLSGVLAATSQASGPNDERAEAWRLAKTFTARHPYMAEGWLRLISLEASQVLRRDELQKALVYCGGDEHIRELWANELNAIEKEHEAAEFMEASLVDQPFSVGAVLGAAEQYRHAGNESKSMALLERALKWAPENPDLLSAAGYARDRAGKTPEAVSLFKEVLRIKPNSPRIKDYLAQLDAGKASDREFFKAYDIQLKDLTLPKIDAYPKDNVVTLLNQEVARVNPNGSTSRMFHVISMLVRPHGIQELSQHQIYYEPDRQVVDILKASVITPDGRELSRAEVQDRSTSAAMGVQTRIYDEHYLKQVFFKDLEPGSIVDLQYTIRDSGDNIFGDYFADTFYFGSDNPVVKSQYVLDLPKTLNVQTRAFNSVAESEHLQVPDAAREVFRWEATNLPGVTRERNMPPMIDRLPQLQVTTMKSWQEVGQWYWNLAKDQVTCNEELMKDIAEMTKNCKTNTDKVRAIHDAVIRKIRYLGIEFGRNGYKPHKASETYKALYGDCKDTATLLTAMLRAAGIDSHLVLIRTVNAGAIPPDSLPMPNLFNHCIAYVPGVDGKDYWIDGTTDFHHLGEVPYADQSAQVLVIDPTDAKFIQIPKGTPEENLIEQKFAANVNVDGSGTLMLRDVRHGQFAPGYRELADTPGQYERYMKDFAAKRFNGAEVLKLRLADSQDQGPMWMESEFKLPAIAAQSGDRKSMAATFDPLHLSARFASESSRKHDMELYFPWSRKTQISYHLDKALKVVSLPEEAHLQEPFGYYSRKFHQEANLLTMDEQFELTRSRISVGEYEAFKVFCNKVDSLMDQKVLLDDK